MSAHNRVIWSEGLFLQPQHFQQQDRYFERYVESRAQRSSRTAGDSHRSRVERDFLKIGKIGLRRLSGVFPAARRSGCQTTTRCRPDRYRADVRDHGCTWRCRCGGPASSRSAAVPHARSCSGRIREFQAANAAANTSDPAILEVAALRTRLLLESASTEAYALVPLAHVVECRADQQVILDDNFIPTVLQVRAASRLATVTAELLGLFHQRGEALGGRVAATGRGAASELADFLMLQAINRTSRLLAHSSTTGWVHPAALPVLRGRGRNLRRSPPTSKRAPNFRDTATNRLKESFEPVIMSLRESMSKVLSRTRSRSRSRSASSGSAWRLCRTARCSDRRCSCWRRARTARRRRAGAFSEPGQSGAGRAYFRSGKAGLPGVRWCRPVAPRQIPFHAGYAYFELDQSHDLWAQLKARRPGDLRVG